MASLTHDIGTKARLLLAGRKIFAKNGREKATIRDICALAGANVASVNYHFGSKEKLYVAVLQEYIERENRRNPRDLGTTPASDPSKLIQTRA